MKVVYSLIRQQNKDKRIKEQIRVNELMEPSCPLGISRVPQEKVVNKGFIALNAINPLLTKFVWSRWI